MEARWTQAGRTTIAASPYHGPVGLEYKPTGRTEDDFGWMETFGVV
ncbi:hypothetical protein [Saliniramus sp.]|nr:hypothetical protein [Saliniramus sp.]HMB09566.1 hypothetical protein [Saliniramus sp.]